VVSTTNPNIVSAPKQLVQESSSLSLLLMSLTSLVCQLNGYFQYYYCRLGKQVKVLVGQVWSDEVPHAYAHFAEATTNDNVPWNRHVGTCLEDDGLDSQ
jgi:hypothetical protein